MKRKNSFYARKHGMGKKDIDSFRSHKNKEMTGVFYSSSFGGVFFQRLSFDKLSQEKYYVDSDFTLGAMNGDIVNVRATGNRNDVCVTRIVERVVTEVIGTVYCDERDGAFYLEPDSKKFRFIVDISDNLSDRELKDGVKACVKIISYPCNDIDPAIGVVKTVFGEAESVEANYRAILHRLGITDYFPENVLFEADKASSREVTCNGREDFRGDTVFTVDGADCKDMDDAISCKKTDKGYLLSVHIADVSEYVTAGSALDDEAYDRGCSVYFVDKVVPMLPKALSNGICSLDEGVDRNTLSVIIELDKFAEVISVRLCKGVIRSVVRGVYSELNSIFENTADRALRDKYSCITDDGTLEYARELYAVLQNKSESKGVMDLESQESVAVLDECGEPVGFLKSDRGESQRMIEQFMICANEAVAQWLSEKTLPCLYRVHKSPDRDKVSEFIQFAHNLDLSPEYVKKDSVSAAYFSRILEKAKKAGIGYPISYLLLRTMQKAAYSIENTGHFGLVSKCYCHFTSPIRRYPDLVVHRIISEYLKTDDAEMIKKRFTEFADRAAKQSSECEIRALEAERSIEELYKAVYMKKQIGNEFEATVSSVTSYGLFLMLDNTCEGFAPVSLMKNSYWFDAQSITLSCSCKTYSLGDRARIRVKSVDMVTQKAEFEITDEPDLFIFHKKQKNDVKKNDRRLR